MTSPSPLREMLDASVANAHPRSDLATSTLARARTQRRNRVIAAGAALGAAAVVLGFVVVTQPFSTQSAPRPTDVATQGDSAPTPDPDGDGNVSLTLNAPRGPDPRVSWVQGTTLHLSSGETVEFTRPYDNVVAFGSGYLAADSSNGTLDNIQDGDVVATFPASGLLASPDGIFVAWYEESPFNGGRILIRFANGPVRGYAESTIPIPKGMTATPVAFRDQGVLYQTDDQSTGERAVWMSEGDHGVRIDGASAIGGYSPNGDVAVMQTKVTDTGSCWSSYAFPGGEFAGALTEQTCNFSLGELSADGKYLIGWPAYADGWGPGEVAILDAKSFKPVMQFDAGEDYGVMDAVWDGDSDSLIATVYLEGTWQLLRLGTDGSIETASESVVADDVSNPFRMVPGA
jgi:hypothetical protein